MKIKEFINNDLTNVYNADGFPAYCGNMEEPLFYRSPLLSFGDYDNSCQVERSNVRVFIEMFGHINGVKHFTGMFGHEAVILSLELDSDEIIETLSSLEDYPCIDDEDVSFMEMEMIAEYLPDFIKYDLLDCYSDEIREYIEDESTEGERVAAVHKAFEESNFYPEIESGGIVYIDEQRIKDAFLQAIYNTINPE